MGKGTTSSSNVSSSSPDPAAYSAYAALMNRASGVASTPYQSYSGTLSAPTNSEQNLGVAGINTNANYADPYIARAAQLAGASSTPVTSSDIFSYYDPYQQKVIDATTAQLQRSFGQQNAALQGNQISQGALGGNATGVAKAILGGQQAQTLASTTAGLESQGFNTALQAAQRQQQTGLAGANALANYGITGQNAALQGATAQFGVGTQQQQTEQAALDRLYQQYQIAQAFPYQQTQWLAGIDTGVGSNMGGTSYGQTTGTPPNQTAQYLGLGLTAAGLFANRGGRIMRAHGGGVAGHYADGGEVVPFPISIGQEMDNRGRLDRALSRVREQGIPEDDIQNALRHMSASVHEFPRRAGGGGVAGYAVGGSPYEGAPGWIPTISIRGGSGAPQAHAPSLPSQQQQDLSKLTQGVQGLSQGDWAHDWGGLSNAITSGSGMSGDAWGGGSFWSGDTYGGDSAHPAPGMTAEDYGEGYADGGAVSDEDRARGHAALRDRFATNALTQRDGPWWMEKHHGDEMNRDAYHATDIADDLRADWQGKDRFLNHRIVPGLGYAAGGGVGAADMRRGYSTGGNPDDMPDVYPVPQTFEDRAEPVRTAIEEGQFDPRGINATDYAGTPGMVASNNGVVPTPSRRPADAPVMAEGSEDEDEIPTPPTRPRGVAGAPVMAFEDSDQYRHLPDAIRTGQSGVAPQRSFGLGLLSPNVKTGLLTAGLAALSSRSPNLGNALGDAGLAGLNAYGKAEEHDRQVQLEADKLSREARKAAYDEWMGQRKQTETERHNRVSEDKENWTLIPGDGISTADRLYNHASGEIKEVQPGTGQQALNKIKNGEVNYVVGAPNIKQGDTLPEPAPLPGYSAQAIKNDAAYYIATGNLPKASVSPRNPMGMQSVAYQRLIRNYGAALLASKGMSEDDFADIRRFGPQAARFPLSRQGDQTVAIGTAIRHIGALEEYAKVWNAAKGDVNAPILRQAAARFAKAIGAAEPTNLEQAARIAGPEIIKAIGVAGAGTGGERFAQEEGFQPGASIQQILGAANVAKTFLAGQLPAKEAQASAVHFPHDKFMSMVGPTEYDYLSAINHGGKATTPAGGGAPQGGAPVAAPVPPGAVNRKQDTQGIWWYVDSAGKPLGQAPAP